MNRNHPERKPGEVFLTNSTLSEFDEIGWKTKRLGEDAFDEEGRSLTPVFAGIGRLFGSIYDEPRPVFVMLKELEEAAKKEPLLLGLIKDCLPDEQQQH